MSFGHLSQFNRPGMRNIPLPPLPLGKASSSPSKSQLQCWSDRLSDQIEHLEHGDVDILVIRALEDLLHDIEQAAKVAG